MLINKIKNKLNNKLTEMVDKRLKNLEAALNTKLTEMAEERLNNLEVTLNTKLTEMGDERLDNFEVALAQTNSAIKEMPEFIPLPPKDLQLRVVSNYNVAFLDSGYRVVTEIDAFLHQHGLTLADRKNVLEWGCGCGRSLRPLKRLHPHINLHGTDVDPEAILWLQENYESIADFKTNDPYPPIDYPDNKFDLIYAVSVFTHLPEDMQFAWLEELMRLLQPGGIGLFSVHGLNHHGAFKEQLKDTGFYYSEGPLTNGLPSFYRQTYHTPDYIKREWTKYFEILDIVTLGLGNYQDVVVVRKR